MSFQEPRSQKKGAPTKAIEKKKVFNVSDWEPVSLWNLAFLLSFSIRWPFADLAVQKALYMKLLKALWAE